MKAAQLGLRSQWVPSLSSDVVVYTHRYENLYIHGAPTPSFANLPAYVDVNLPSWREMSLSGRD